MRVEATNRVLGAGAFLLALASWACGGREVLDLGGDAAAQSAEGDDGASSSDGGTTGPGAGQDGAASGSGSGGAVPANTIVCDYAVCSASDVCCEQYGKVSLCEAVGQCNDVAVRCRADTDCPAGSSCCFFGSTTKHLPGPTYYVGSTQCLEGATCPAGSQPTCSPSSVPGGCAFGQFADSICINGSCLNLGTL